MSKCNILRVLVIVVLAWCFVTDSLAQTAPPVSNNPTHQSGQADPLTEIVVLPESVPDPIEPVNRAIWAFNKGVMARVVKPSARVYRFVVRKPVRTAVGNFGTNITYPGRLLNNLLQGKWTGARNETDRFLCNTVVGVGGLFDVASKWKIPKSEADFGQTFGQWGWKPRCYLMLPIFGPSNERDTLGFGVDTAANPLTYLSPYRFASGDPVTYVSPYTYSSYATTYNNQAGSVDESVRFTQTQMDPYSILQYAWTFVRENRVADFQIKGDQDEASLETLQSVFFTFKEREFPNRSKTRSVLIPATGKRLKFTYWLQPGKAPVVYIVPGLGSHRLAETALALAELIYEQGFSVVTVSSPYNFEFMEHASTVAVPADTAVDARDLHGALTQIDHRLQTLYPGRLGAKALMGYSMGAFQSLFVAAGESTQQTSLLKFNRYIAIHAPVRLLHGISKLDELYQAPLEWPVEQRTTNIENTFLKVAALSNGSLLPQGSPPFDAIESKFLIGLTFRFILRDVIFSSQRRNNQSILKHPIHESRRDRLYREILQFSYNDYWKKSVVPYYQTRGVDLTEAEALKRAGDLRTYASDLKANPNVHLIVNRNDILLAEEDLAWLESTFEPNRLTVFEKGGHLGNLSHPAVQKAILRALDGMK